LQTSPQGLQRGKSDRTGMFMAQTAKKQKLDQTNSQLPSTERRPRGNPNWVPGCPSANPGGRPKVIAEVKELAQLYSVEAIQALYDIMTDDGKSAAARVTAANSILDRAFGKPVQAVTGLDGGPVQIERIEQIVVDPRRDAEDADYVIVMPQARQRGTT
jgi:hypothetical protein